MIGLFDSFQRRINYLRISVTDRCNLRCICMPSEGIPRIPHDEILSYEEIRAVVQAAAELGINKIRLTGGEPLVRSELPKLIRILSQIEGIDDIALTTNGTLLRKYAPELKQAGLVRVNISLDTLKDDRFRYITRLGDLEDTLEGIKAARNVGLQPVKINTVVMRGINDDEVLDFANMTYKEAWHIRFIELMPVGDVVEFVPSSELRRRISSLGALEPCSPLTGSGPAKCVRLSSGGKLRPCLLVEDEIDLKGPLRNNASMQELKRLILKAVASKPEHHHLGANAVPVDQKMSQIGG